MLVHVVSLVMWSVVWRVLLEISECCSPTAVIATNTLRLDVSAVADLVTHKEVCHQRVCVCVCDCHCTFLSQQLSIYNNRIVAMATGRGWRGRASVGRQTPAASSERGQTTCADRLRVPAKREGAAQGVAYGGGQATIEHRRTVGQTCKPTAQIVTTRTHLLAFCPGHPECAGTRINIHFLSAYLCAYLQQL